MSYIRRARWAHTWVPPPRHSHTGCGSATVWQWATSETATYTNTHTGIINTWSTRLWLNPFWLLPKRQRAAPSQTSRAKKAPPPVPVNCHHPPGHTLDPWRETERGREGETERGRQSAECEFVCFATQVVFLCLFSFGFTKAIFFVVHSIHMHVYTCTCACLCACVFGLCKHTFDILLYFLCK